MNYKDLAGTIIKNIGGEENIQGLTHCATRLRFNLKNDQIPNETVLKETSGIMGVVNKGGQYQVIIGSDVGNVYKEIMNQTDFSLTDSTEKDNHSTKSKVAKVIDTITGIFTPILPAITAAGMLKAVLSLLIVFKVLTIESQSYQILNFMADSAFYFLPILLAVSSAQKFKANMYLAIMLGGILLHPNFTAMVAAVKQSGGGIHLFGLPISAVSYSSSVIPIILSVWFLSYVEPIADRVSPNAIKFFSKPLLSIAIVGIVTLTVLGPVGYQVSDWISTGVKFLEGVSPWIVPLIVGTFMPLLVATGTHYGLVPIGINNRMTNGYDAVIYPGMLASNVSQGAAAVAVGIKSKNKTVKQLAFSAGLTAIFGITEPALYGINLRFKTPLYSAMIGGGMGGLLMGILRVKNFSGGSPGLLTLPSYIGENTLTYFYFACLGAVVSMVITFVLTLIMFKEPVTEEAESANGSNSDLSPSSEKETVIYAPINGTVVSLKSIEDGMFSEEILGQGMAIIPEEGKVYAPFRGTVTALFDSCHAIGLTSDTGVELLIHVGIDTVQLHGEGYAYHVKKGQVIETGDLLVTFDLEVIQSSGLNPVTPIVVTNTNDVGEILTADEGEITVGKQIARIF